MKRVHQIGGVAVLAAALSTLLVQGVSAGSRLLAPKTFDFADPKGVNGISFLLDSELEPVVGTVSGIKGTITFDPTNPGASRGTITADAKTLSMTNADMALHAREDVLNVTKNPEFRFEITSIEDVRPRATNEFQVNVKGNFSVGGKTKAIVAPARVTYLPGQLKARLGSKNGDLLVIRTQFSFKRSEFDLGTMMETRKIADQIDVRAHIVGQVISE